MDNQTIINKTVDFVKMTLAQAEGGHDWWHIYRVWKNAQHIAKQEETVVRKLKTSKYISQR